MSLPVPLTVRVGSKHLTREVSGLTFRREAVGGIKSIGLNLARPLDRFDSNLAPFATCYLYDARSAKLLGTGRLSDPGRSADMNGQTWDLVAFGPAIHATDVTKPYIIIDSSLERWNRSFASTRNATTDQGELSDGKPLLEIVAEEGKTISTSWVGEWTYRALVEAGQSLARLGLLADNGVTDANYRRQYLVDGVLAANVASSTVPASHFITVVTNFAAGLARPSIRAARVTAATTGAEAHWFRSYDVYVRALLKDATGADITTGYGNDYVLAHEVVTDLIGRFLTKYDGTLASIATTGAHQIDQLAYPDGVTPEQVLNDLMLLEPAFRWYLTDAGVFRWEAWPTTVRYEITLDDGADFPSTSQELYNQVTVRYRKRNGQVGSVTRTLACALLTAAGLTRTALIDLGDEVGSATAAARIGDGFLAEHNVPINAGTLTVARPIRDNLAGCLVQPWEIQPGELVRARGVESYANALNPSSRDGATVFRIRAVDYSSDTNSARLELDSDSRTVTNALAALKRRRNRKR